VATSDDPIRGDLRGRTIGAKLRRDLHRLHPWGLALSSASDMKRGWLLHDVAGFCAGTPAARMADTMQPIDRQALSTVTGGFLGALLAAAPGILQGVSGIIAASKSGGGGGSQPAPSAPPPQPAPASAPAPAPSQPAPAASMCACACDPLRSQSSVSTSVQIG
jgi:hypothetical protein